MKEKKKPSKTAETVSGLLVVVVFLVIGILTWNSGDETGEESYSPNLAYNYAEDFVENQLKSPASAEFPGIFERQDHIRQINDNTFEIDSWVDSQNGFGTMIRTRFKCKIKFEGDNARLVYMNIE